VLFVAMLVALGLVGATYAYWSDTLTVSGTVGMGTFDVKFGTPNVDETEPSGYESVANMECAATDDNTVEITVTNAYPGWSATCTIPVVNNGSIPAKVSVGSLQALDGYNLPPSGWVTVSPSDSFDLAVGGSQNLVITVNVPADEDGYQGQTFGFTMTLNAEQFNAP